MAPESADDGIRVVGIGFDADDADRLRAHLSEPVTLERATGPEEAVDCLDGADCFVTDHDPPGVDGLAVLERIRAVDADVPVFLFARRKDERLVTDALEADADGYLDRRAGEEQYALLARHVSREVTRYRTLIAADGQRRRQLQLLEAADDVFWMFTADWGEVVYIGQGYRDLWGQSIDEVRANPESFLEAVHPDDRDRVRTAMEALSVGDPVELEYRVNPGEAFGRWVWVKGRPIFEDGDLAYVAGFARDVTDRKEHERELERTERRLSLALDAVGGGVWEWDVEADEVVWDETKERQVGHEPGTFDGTPRSFVETIHPEEREEVCEAIERALESGEDFHREYRYRHESGETRWLESNARVVTDEGGTPRRVVGVDIDVTDRKARERQLEESNERLERFAYVASHDLQEPLRTVSNYVQLVAEDYGDQLDEAAHEFVDVAVTGTERMQSMIDALLDYSRVTTRGQAFESVDVERVVDDVVDDLEFMLEERKGTVRRGSLPTVEADVDQLRQVFQNLVKNALEHADGPVTVEIDAEERASDYRFEVADDGPGIPPRQHEKIFRMFKSTEQYQTTGQAKGIGLAICDIIVRRHGGEIWVESEPGDGAAFVFTLPKHPDTDSL